jgi:hypothetical protein
MGISLILINEIMKKLLNVGILLLCFSPLVTVAQYAGFIDLRSSAGTNCEFIALNTVIFFQ